MAIMQPKKLLDNGGESGIIKEKTKGNITSITDKTIESVPKVEISGFTDEQCDYIQSQHKELLKYSRDNNDNNEVAFVFNSDLSKRYEFMGTNDSVDFGNSLFGKGNELFIMHNHPRNGGFSFDDVSEFITNDKINVLSIVKNNGNVEILKKGLDFNVENTLIQLKRSLKKKVSNKTNVEYQNAVKDFLDNINKKGDVIKWMR